MTAVEKITLARFLDLAAAVLRDGHRREEPVYQFEDDPPPAVADGNQSEADSLPLIAENICSCAACSLGKTRTRAVPGEGVEHPLVMVIGEGPGAEEDASGRPFVGEAGRLLDKMLESIGLSRNSNVFIANVVKCRPPNNRDPLPAETAACVPFLERQIRLLKPQYILCAGRVAAQTLLKTGDSIGRLRGRFCELPLGDADPIPLIVTYHPSALLRNSEFKRPAWEDLKMLKTRLGEN